MGRQAFSAGDLHVEETLHPIVIRPTVVNRFLQWVFLRFRSDEGMRRGNVHVPPRLHGDMGMLTISMLRRLQRAQPAAGSQKLTPG